MAAHRAPSRRAGTGSGVQPDSSARYRGCAVNAASARADRIVPRRIANMVGIAIAIVAFWSIANGLIFRAALRVMDSSFERLDALFEPERMQPTSALKTGSPASLLRWDELGRTGRGFVVSGPSGADISAFTTKDALDPIRVYVGLRSAETARDRAKLALEELKRVRAFDRSILIVITPTGTGWVDPSPRDTSARATPRSIGSSRMGSARWSCSGPRPRPTKKPA